MPPQTSAGLQLTFLHISEGCAFGNIQKLRVSLVSGLLLLGLSQCKHICRETRLEVWGVESLTSVRKRYILSCHFIET